MDRWLFETPWWLLIAIAAAAVAVLISGNNRQNNRVKLAGVAILAGGLLLFAVSWLIDTPREICVRQTRQWVSAVVAKDQATLGAMLHPKAALGSRWNRTDILAGAQKYAEIYGLSSATVLSISGNADPAMVTVNLSLLSRHDAKVAAYNTINSSWELNWVKAPAGWQIKDIIPLKVGMADREQVQSMLFNSPAR